MTARFYRRRPPKDGGTHVLHTPDTAVVSQPRHSNVQFHNNPYHILSPYPIQPQTTNKHTHLPPQRFIFHREFHRTSSDKNRSKRSHNAFPTNFTLIKNKKNVKQHKNYSKLHNKTDKNLTNLVRQNEFSTKFSRSSKNLPSIQKRTFHSLFSIPRQSTSPLHPSSSSATMSSSLAHTSISPDKPVQEINPSDPITIDSFTDDSEIKNINVEDTWKTYVFNSEIATITKEDWDNLPNDEKYEELFQLKPTKQSEISSESTTFIVKSNTTEKEIQKIPKKDCKLLLRAYAISQGYSHYLSRIDAMKVDAIRDELVKAKKKLSTRPQNSPQLTKKKTRNIEVPLVITHDTTNEEIEAASESSILHELQTMYTDRGLFDSIMWESLNVDE